MYGIVLCYICEKLLVNTIIEAYKNGEVIIDLSLKVVDAISIRKNVARVWYLHIDTVPTSGILH